MASRDDAVDRKRLAVLRESERHLEIAVSNLPIVLWKVDRRGTITVVRGHALDGLGIDPGEWLGRSVFDLFPESPAVAENHRRALAGEAVVAFVEVRGRLMDAWYCPVSNDSGAIDGVLGVALDATERRRAERDRDRFFEMALDMLAIAGFDGTLKDVNPAWERILGFPEEELRGRPYLDLIHPDDRDTVVEEVRKLISGASIHDLEARFVASDGSHRWMLWNATPFPAEDLIYATGRDIDDRKRMERELLKARDAAVEAARLKSAFLANMSHEIRSPLNVILGSSSLLREEFQEGGVPAPSQVLDAIDRAGQRLISTIHGILDISKIEAGAFELQPVICHVAAIIERCVEEIRVLAMRKGLSIDCEIDEPDTTVVFDEYCLSGALTNLLQNAVKFTDKGGVTVKLARDGRARPFIEIRDTGIGIDPAFRKRLFEPFVQERSGYGRRFEGSGLGLALTREYLEMNGASISVESEKGKGSVFRIELPDRRNESGEEEPSPAVS